MNTTFSPKVSVIIPTYNRAKTIGYCLDSVLNQTVPPFEVIVVDDCSTDDTVRIVRDYKDERVRCIILGKNSGAQVARNRGIQEARGEWIAFQDSDDEWHLDKLKKQVEILDTVNFNPWTVVHTNALLYDISSGNKTIFNSSGVSGENVYSSLLKEPGPLFPTLLVSKLALEKINYLDEKVPSFQEWDTSIRLAQYCRFFYLVEPLFIYHLHSGETISKDKIRDLRGYQYIVAKFENDIKTQCGEEVWQRHLLILIEKYLENGLWHEAENLFKELALKNNAKYKLLRLSYLLRFPPSKLSNYQDQFQTLKSRIIRKAKKILNQNN